MIAPASRIRALTHRISSIPWRKLAVTLVIGSIGGWLFSLLNLPLAWMIGAMVITTIAALSKMPLVYPGRLRSIMVAILGVMVGSSFSPETVDRIDQWLLSIALLLTFSVLITIAIGYVLMRKPGMGPADAFCSSSPGGFTEMVLLAHEMGGDERTVSIIHTVRIMATVIAIPIWFKIFRGYDPNTAAAAFTDIAHISANDTGLLIASAVIGYIAARLLRLPLPYLAGPMVVSAFVHAMGWTTARPPGELVAFAQVVFGASIGARFIGVAVNRIVNTIWLALMITLVILVAALGLAWLATFVTGLPAAALVLSYAPGGVAEMNMVAVALDIDPAMVAIHHLSRIAFLLIIGPFLLRGLVAWTRRSKQAPETPPAGGE